MEGLKISGEKVVLRPTRREDLPFLQELWNDGAAMRFVGYPQGLGIDEQEVQEWFERINRQRGQDHEHWIIESKQCEPIGEAFYKAEREYYGYRAEKMAAIDIKLAKHFWGRGYASDTLRTLAHHLFEERGFETLIVSPNLNNQAALKLYKHYGFEPQHSFYAEETKAEHQVWALRKAKYRYG